MKRNLCIAVVITSAVALFLGAADDSQSRVVRHIRHELVMLPYYGVFDNLTYSLNGREVRLMGEVSRPTLKSDAAAVVKNVVGVETVVNEIEVLPLSPSDDQIRIGVYRAIYGENSPLNRYAMQAVPPIHIIVKNGNVKLVGFVASDGDRTIANVRANGVSGVFSVRNELETDKKENKKEK